MNSLPKGWRLVELDGLKARGASSLIGGPFGSDLTQRDYIAEPGVPVIRGSNLDGKNSRFIDDGFVYVSARKALQLTRNLAFPGDVIFTQRGTLGQVAIIPQGARFERYVISQSQMKLTPDETVVDRNYLYYYFRAPRTIQRLLAETQATGVPHINLGILKRFRVALPPLPEQRRIAEILDKADALRAKRRAALAQLDTLTQSIFLDMFGDPGVNKKGWPVLPLGEAFACPPVFGTMIPANDGGGDWLSIRVANIQGWRLDLSDRRFVDLPSKDVPRHSVSDGDLLMARAIASEEHLGKCVVARPGRERWAFDSHLMRIRFNRSKADAEFIRHLLMTPGGRSLFLRSTRRSAVQFNINTKEIAALRLPIPPIQRQREFVDCLCKVTATHTLHCKSVSELDALFASLQHRAFRGEL